MRGRYSTPVATLLGGCIAGIVDFGAASLINWASPVFIGQAVASGLLGKASFSGGMETAILGFFLQLGMSLLIAAIYVAASNVLTVLKTRWLVWGLAYGVGVFFVMNYVVVPLSAVGHMPHFTIPWFAENMAAMLLFGVIIAYFARARPDGAKA